MNLLKPFYKKNHKWIGTLLSFLFFEGLVIILIISGIVSENYLMFLSGCGFTLVILVGCLILYLSKVIKNNEAYKDLLCIPGFDANRFLREYEKSPQVRNLLMTSDVICLLTDPFIQIIPLQDIIWAYQMESQNKNVCQVFIFTRNKASYTIPIYCKNMDGDAICRYLFRLIRRRRPSAYIGYREDWELMSKKNFNEFVMGADAQPMLSAYEMEMLYIDNNLYVADLN